ncbi:homoprotocatechuate degradation operon regulator HpaR [Halioxenophilus aromaticivorans]
MNKPKKLPTLLLSARSSFLPHLRTALQDFGLSEQQWRIIEALQEHPGCCFHELVKMTCILGPSLSHLVAKLEKLSLLNRWQNETDQRSKRLALTEEGNKLYELVNSELDRSYYHHLHHCLDGHELDQLMKLLNKIVKKQGGHTF